MLTEVHRMVPYARLRERPEAADIARRELRTELLNAVDGAGLIQWTETKDPILEAVTFTAKLEAITPAPRPGPQPAFPVKPPSVKPNTSPEEVAALRDAIKRNFYADLPDGSLLGGPLTGRQPTTLITATAAEAVVAPPKPTPTPAALAAAARKAVLADVSAALDAVEADLLPGTDPGFVVALLRDRLKEMEK